VSRVAEVGQRLRQDLPRLAEEHDVPGVSVAVLVDGQVVEGTAGVVNRRTGEVVTPDALFQIQSITKVWTATLVMQLVDDGLIGLDEPVRTYLPSFRTADEDLAADITVRHLLTHTGGFEGDIWAATTSGEDALQRFVDDLVSTAPQHSRPGEFYSYCSAGYGVLGRLLEVTRGMSYAAAFRRFLSEPLGIDELAFCADEALAFRTAIGHSSTSSDAAQQPLKTWSPLPPSNPAAGNQLAMSARALVAFAGMHAAGGVTSAGVRVLSASSVRAMQERQVDHPGVPGSSDGHGLGWFVSSRAGLIEHGGASIGVEALLQMAPERGVAIAMLTNGSGAVGPLTRDLISPLLSDLAGIDAPEKPPAPAIDTPFPNPDRYLGSYETRVTLNKVTVDGEGRLWLDVSDRNEAVTMAAVAGVPVSEERYELRPIGDDTVVLMDEAGTPARVAQFYGSDATGRACFLRTGRAAPRRHD
jgi:CubicO group peptidase (beta-lactamase class C family)